MAKTGRIMQFYRRFFPDLSKRHLSEPSEGLFFGRYHPYNKRWQFIFRSAYTAEPVNDEPRSIKETKTMQDDPYMGSFRRDFWRRIYPGWKLFEGRLHRFNNPFDKAFLPLNIMLCLAMWPLSFTFKLWSLVLLSGAWVRYKNKSLDPDLPETKFLEMIFTNPQIKKYFNNNSTVLLDFECDYQKGFPSAEEFPEFENAVFRFFNGDTNMTKGRYVFGDLENGATMRIDFETMPVRSESRFQVGEPFYFFDVVANITHKGVFQKVVVVDRAQTLKYIRPFLLNI